MRAIQVASLSEGVAAMLMARPWARATPHCCWRESVRLHRSRSTSSFRFSIGLASYLAVLEGCGCRTGKEVYLTLFRYWLKIFAIAFAMGVVSGIVMTYQFGTNWSVFSDRAGPVIGPLMAYEVLTAFFSKRASSASCCSGWSGSARSSTSSPPAWSPSAPPSPPSGS
jgi:hypothetical protein